MSNAIKFIFAFSLGAAAGSLVARKVLKTKYERIAQEEIDSVKEKYSVKKNDVETPKATDDNLDDDDPTSISNILAEYNSTGERKETDRIVTKPYVISPDEYGDLDYETASLTYYADGVLADEFDTVIHNVDEIVGEESLEHFGDYEDDSVFVRNDELKCDYEILRDLSTYSEAIGSNL